MMLFACVLLLAPPVLPPVPVRAPIMAIPGWAPPRCPLPASWPWDAATGIDPHFRGSSRSRKRDPLCY